jgi:hypothetical protein
VAPSPEDFLFAIRMLRFSSLQTRVDMQTHLYRDAVSRWTLCDRYSRMNAMRGVGRLVATREDPQHRLTGTLTEVADRGAIEEAVSREDETWKRGTRWKPKLRNRFVTVEPGLYSKCIRKSCTVIGLASHVEDPCCQQRSK